jgi:hypothetical protein
MPEFKAFLSWTYPIEVLRERCSIIEDIMRYALKGADCPYEGKRHPKAFDLECNVKAAMYQSFQQLVKPSRFTKGLEGDTNELLFAAFEEARWRAHVDSIRAIPHFRSPELTSAFGKKFFAKTISGGEEAHPSVEGALDLALNNFQQCESRLVSLYVLHDLTRLSEYGNQPELLGFDELRKAIWQRREKFLRDAATFGALLGGAKAAAVARLLALESCHKENAEGIQYALIHFLTPDGRVPGRWLSEPESKFKADIAARYNALKESE